MRKFMLSLLLGLMLVSGVAMGGGVELSAPDPTAATVPTEGPLDSRLKVLSALRRNDAATLIEVTDPVNGLESFLSEGQDQTPSTIAEKMAKEPLSEGDQEALRLWTTLAAPDGVAKASAQWYPQWQALVPQMLASAQMGITGMGTAIAESTSMTALERSQLIELQWALGGWLSRTDFADRKKFDQVLDIARGWIVASGKQHPLQLQLTGPEQRLQLADQAIKSLKQVLSLYGLDADGVLASVRLEEISRNGERAQVRTSFKLLDVPLVFDEDLSWFEGEWRDTEVVNALKLERANAPEPAFDDLLDPLPDTDEPESITNTGCSAPVAI
ncbi:MAG: hypothetical protein IPO66_01070 [Rhodanobacteraceae bacterium]|nr:hypothetical protein [Rhodanobacteraceae bacterium]